MKRHVCQVPAWDVRGNRGVLPHDVGLMLPPPAPHAARGCSTDLGLGQQRSAGYVFETLSTLLRSPMLLVMDCALACPC